MINCLCVYVYVHIRTHTCIRNKAPRQRECAHTVPANEDHRMTRASAGGIAPNENPWTRKYTGLFGSLKSSYSRSFRTVRQKLSGAISPPHPHTQTLACTLSLTHSLHSLTHSLFHSTHSTPSLTLTLITHPPTHQPTHSLHSTPLHSTPLNSLTHSTHSTHSLHSLTPLTLSTLTLSHSRALSPAPSRARTRAFTQRYQGW